jgi:hypothetical protein
MMMCRLCPPAPTPEELTSQRPAYLPRNDGSRVPRADEAEEESAYRHIETHFRLLRHEMVAPLQEGLQAVLKTLQSGPRGAAGMFVVRGANTMSYVLSGARVDGCNGNHNSGLYFTVRDAS